MSALALALVLLLTAPGASEEPLARTHTVSGEIVRLDLARERVVLKQAEPLREYEIRVDPEKTRIVSQGRTLRLEDVPTEVRGFVVCEDDGQGNHLARLLRVGAPGSARADR